MRHQFDWLDMLLRDTHSNQGHNEPPFDLIAVYLSLNVSDNYKLFWNVF